MTTTEELIARRDRVIAQGAVLMGTPEGKAAMEELFAGDRARIRAGVDDAEAAVQAARDALTQGPTDVASKALAEAMFARVWPTIKADIEGADDGGVGVAREAIESADDAVRPLLTQSIIETLRAKGLPERTIDAYVLMPTSPEWEAAFEALRKTSTRALIALHNLDQIEQGTDNLVALAAESE